MLLASSCPAFPTSSAVLRLSYSLNGTSKCFSTAFPGKFVHHIGVTISLQLRRRYQISNISFVPSLIHQIVHHPRFATADLSTVKGIGSGAAYLPQHLSNQLHARIPTVGRFTEGAFLFPSCVWISCFTVYSDRLRLV